MSLTYDVGIIGAGPAGAVAAGFLSKMGFRVVVFEKEKFPRFHIGESLIPKAVPVLMEMGLDLDQSPFALRKAGARFASEENGLEFRFDFTQVLPGCFTHAYQVERSPFDEALAKQAAILGADVRFNHTVSHWQEDLENVRVFGNWGQTDCRYLVDASGQQSLMSRMQGTKSRIRGLGKCGTFTHFQNVSSLAARDIFRDGDILLLMTKCQGWGWAIPLPGDRLSLGVVIKDDGQPVLPPDRLLGDYIEASPILKSILDGANQSAPLRRVADYSYYNTVPSTKRVTSLGDARGFLDPIFSSGITLAVFTAHELAKLIAPTVADNTSLDLEVFHQDMRRGYETFQRIIERFYRPGWAQKTFFFEEKSDDIIRQITTILAGDVWRHDNPFQNMLLASQRTSVRYEEVHDARVNGSEVATYSGDLTKI